MNRWVCAILLLASAAFSAPSAYSQSQPCLFGNACPANCTVPAVIVGTLSGRRVGSGFVVTVRDDSNQPVASRYVKVDFTNSAIIPTTAQVFPTYNDCGGGRYRIMQSTNTNGQATIDAAFTGFTNSTNVDVYVESNTGSLILLAHIKGRSTDCVTGNGSTESTGLADYSYFSNAYGTNTQETDFDQDGTTGLGDLSIFSAEYGGPSANLCTP